VLGNLAVLRDFHPMVPASLLAALLVIAIPGGALVGLGLGAYQVARQRLQDGQGREAGSVLKVSMVLVLCLGLVATVVGLQVAYGVLGGLFPASATGSLFLYRALVVLPAVGCSSVLVGGLLAVDRPRAVWPGLVVTSVGSVVAAGVWVGRGAGLPGYELAGAGLALPIAVLLGTMTFGALLFAIRAGREQLNIHLAKPFATGDALHVLRHGWRPGLALSLIAAVLLTWVWLAYRDASSLPAVPALSSILFTGLALSTVLVSIQRTGQAHRGLTVLVLAVLVLPGVGLLVVPRLTLSPFSPYVDAIAGARLVGALLLHEVALWLATLKGWLELRRPLAVEMALLAGLAVGAGALMAALGVGGWPGLVMVLLVCRGLTVPLLRR